mgnify:CR=1 FL=1
MVACYGVGVTMYRVFEFVAHTPSVNSINDFIHQPDLVFESVFPALDNAHHKLDSNVQSKYHAYCVMAGNFSQMMWRALSQEMKALGLPDDILHAYLAQNTLNYIQSPETAATGPLQRGDIKTIDKHMNALPEGDMKNIYKAYLDWQLNPETDKQHKAAS